MPVKKIVIFASGSGSSAENIFHKFSDNANIEVEKLYCNNPDAYVLQRFKNYEINKMIFNNSDLNSETVLDDLIKVNPELIVLAGFLRKIPKKIIEIFKNKIINIHPSLLPKYKGLNTHERVINNGERFTGCTVHHVNKFLDSGKIVIQKKIRIDKNDNPKSIEKKVLKIEHKIYPQAICTVLSSL